MFVSNKLFITLLKESVANDIVMVFTEVNYFGSVVFLFGWLGGGPGCWRQALSLSAVELRGGRERAYVQRAGCDGSSRSECSERC